MKDEGSGVLSRPSPPRRFREPIADPRCRPPMDGSVLLVMAVLLAVEPVTGEARGQPPAAGSTEDPASAPEEPKEGAGVSPVELIPRLELRQSTVDLEGGVAVHDTTTQIDIQFLGRMLVRYEAPLRTMKTPAGQLTGLGDTRIEVIGVVASATRYVAAAIAGAVLDTATQPPLGAGKQQIVFGGGLAVKPARWWLAYLLLQEQISVGGDRARPDVNQLVARLGNVAFGTGYAWYKLDLDTVVDFEGGTGRLFGRFEVGRLLIGRVGLFMRAGTQLLGPRQVDYSLEVGVRYLFRLDKGI
jgi:hypothetical protein